MKINWYFIWFAQKTVNFQRICNLRTRFVMRQFFWCNYWFHHYKVCFFFDFFWTFVNRNSLTMCAREILGKSVQLNALNYLEISPRNILSFSMNSVANVLRLSKTRKRCELFVLIYYIRTSVYVKLTQLMLLLLWLFWNVCTIWFCFHIISNYDRNSIFHKT